MPTPQDRVPVRHPRPPPGFSGVCGGGHSRSVPPIASTSVGMAPHPATNPACGKPSRRSPGRCPRLPSRAWHGVGPWRKPGTDAAEPAPQTDRFAPPGPQQQFPRPMDRRPTKSDRLRNPALGRLPSQPWMPLPHTGSVPSVCRCRALPLLPRGSGRWRGFKNLHGPISVVEDESEDRAECGDCGRRLRTLSETLDIPSLPA